jgi:hypothetical protein
MGFLYSITYSILYILTVFISASIIRGVQPPFEMNWTYYLLLYNTQKIAAKRNM